MLDISPDEFLICAINLGGNVEVNEYLENFDEMMEQVVAISRGYDTINS